MFLYSYGKCSTCKQAASFLKQRRVAFETKEITLTTPSLSELKQMLHHQGGQLKKLFNTSGLLYKEMRLSEKLPHMSLEESLQLLHEHGMLIKRPFLIGKDFGFTGFHESAWSSKFTPETPSAP